MEKNDILIVGLCIALLFLWFAKRPLTPPPPHSVTQKTAESSQPPSDNAAADPGQKSGESTLNPDQISTQLSEAESPYHPDYLSLDPSPEVQLNVNSKFAITIDPQSGGITDVVLLKFQKDKKSKTPIHLNNKAYPIHSIQNRDNAWKFSNAKIESQSDQHLSISRSIANTHLILGQTWKIDPLNPYEIAYHISFRNDGDTPVNFDNIIINCGMMDPLDTAQGFMGAGGLDQKIDILLDESDSPKTVDLNKLQKYDEEDHLEASHWQVKWIAVQNKYFVSFLKSETLFPGCKLAASDLESTEQEKNDGKTIIGQTMLPELLIHSQGTVDWKLNAFIGPKQYNLLKNQGNNAESILQFDLFLFFHFDWVKGISLVILWGMNQLEGIFHNYGLAIIFITIIIRGIFWPITHKSTVWSKQMQKIQPLAQEIREKYKSDPQKMQQKTMELYREHKINPVAGCLPMLLQVPVFFSLFNVFRSAIELRQASFLWAADLSRQDTVFVIPIGDIPINPLALLMGVTMFLQQKTMPTSPDPMQQKVMMFMTIFFVFMLYPMPSGLTLYWTINQIISIVQYRITHNMESVKA